MFGSTIQRHLIALIGAFVMSTVAVSAAVAPAATSSQAVAVNA